MKEILKKEIDRLVSKYPQGDKKEIFRLELELLVTLAEREQIRENLENLK